MQANLLLVDDDSQNLELLEAILEPLGHKMLVAKSGPEALEILDKERIDLVLLDLMMPEITGFDVLSKVRALPSYRNTPVVLLTAASDRQHRLKGLQLGATEFLEKPVDQSILVARVRSLLQLQFATDELVRRNEELETLRRNQEEMIHFIAHDVRNPLSVIRGNLAFLNSDVEMSRLQRMEAIEDADRAVRQADGMLSDLLAVARAEQVSMEVRKTLVSPMLLLGHVRTRNLEEARWRGIDFQIDVQNDADLYGDDELLLRVFDNIIGNALRHTPRGGRILAAARREQMVEIRLANTGPPIPAEERERVFEKFWRAKGSGDRGAVGLGLYFCRLVVEAHGGRISIEQTENWPVMFVITLPINEE